MKKIAIISFLVLLIISFLLLGMNTIHDEEEDKPEQNEEKEPDFYSSLPDISTFLTQKSDQFIVDTENICDGHPLKGLNADFPHPGAHVHFDNSANTWPTGINIPQNYPKIYAPADGIVVRVDYVYSVDSHERYGFDIAFAKDNNGSVYLFCYSIEPMIMEPSENFYKDFILVSEGQNVSKGDIIAFMFIPSNSGLGIHIHFHILKLLGVDFMAPAIFNSTIVDQFHAKWNYFTDDNGTTMPPCMGYRLQAQENPFGTGAKDIL